MKPQPTRALKTTLAFLLLGFALGCASEKPSSESFLSPDHKLKYPNETPAETAAWDCLGCVLQFVGPFLASH
jgi:hypothetical protein